MLFQIATLIGYLSSVFLAISLMINNDLKFRWINALGCISFIVYGMMITAFPIVLTNALLLFINLYYLVKIYRTEEDFDLIELKGDEKLVRKFLNFYAKDIQHYFPGFREGDHPYHLSFVVLRNLAIANIFFARLHEDGTARIELNYTVPKYRDYKVGWFIFKKENEFLRRKGVKRLVYDTVANKGHERFLKKMGFQKTGPGPGAAYTKAL